MEECLKENVIEYLATVGLRAKDNEVNKIMYTTLVSLTFKVIENDEIDLVDYLYFLDCVAHNVLNVQIFNCPTGEYTVNLKSKYRDEILYELYETLEKKKYRFTRNLELSCRDKKIVEQYTLLSQ